MTLRWICTYMIAEYDGHDGHDGHADLVRERIDGTTGVRPAQPPGSRTDWAWRN